MADFLEFDGGFAPDIDTMDREELQACLKEVRERIADLDEREPVDMNSEEYEAWGECHEELEDLADEIVERLEEKRLLTRSVSPGDGRCKLLHLTEEGRCFYQEFIAITEEVHRQAEQGFSPEELALLQELLHRVADNLTRETEEPSK